MSGSPQDIVSRTMQVTVTRTQPDPKVYGQPPMRHCLDAQLAWWNQYVTSNDAVIAIAPRKAAIGAQPAFGKGDVPADAACFEQLRAFLSSSRAAAPLPFVPLTPASTVEALVAKATSRFSRPPPAPAPALVAPSRAGPAPAAVSAYGSDDDFDSDALLCLLNQTEKQLAQKSKGAGSMCSVSRGRCPQPLACGYVRKTSGGRAGGPLGFECSMNVRTADTGAPGALPSARQLPAPQSSMNYDRSSGSAWAAPPPAPGAAPRHASVPQPPRTFDQCSDDLDDVLAELDMDSVLRSVRAQAPVANSAPVRGVQAPGSVVAAPPPSLSAPPPYRPAVPPPVHQQPQYNPVNNNTPAHVPPMPSTSFAVPTGQDLDGEIDRYGGAGLTAGAVVDWMFAATAV